MKLPRYKQLHQKLKNDILSGHYTEGSLLPSENTLSAEHKITRVMVRQALSALEQEGYIARRQGKGSIVCAQQPALGLLSFRGFSEVVGETEHQPKSIFLQKPILSDWDSDFFFNVSAEEEEAGCIMIGRLRQVDSQPVMLEYTYLPNIGIPSFTDKKWVQNSLFRTLYHHYQIEITNVDQRIWAISAESDVSGFLGIAVGSPILHIQRQYGTNRPDYFVYSSLYCNTDHYAIGTIIK
ncbi:GntR family transcriptional regulator [Tunicatimonas pelagia]|uniref:GntR family transcriptional regulator n=1 Tax=Tunicatimonas pelagia TaxID=931531 RepID=UPI002664FD42|nr:GntR family transcriptional regulator [Tunicatimonas pelagia]WKN42391.1 GntR family transcriptional regulator [Tunicatimonas pelagia]